MLLIVAVARCFLFVTLWDWRYDSDNGLSSEQRFNEIVKSNAERANSLLLNIIELVEVEGWSNYITDGGILSLLKIDEASTPFIWWMLYFKLVN